MTIKNRVLNTLERIAPTTTTLNYIQNQHLDITKEDIYFVIEELIEEGQLELAGGIFTFENFHNIAIKIK